MYWYQVQVLVGSPVPSDFDERLFSHSKLWKTDTWNSKHIGLVSCVRFFNPSAMSTEIEMLVPLSFFTFEFLTLECLLI